MTEVLDVVKTVLMWWAGLHVVCMFGFVVLIELENRRHKRVAR